MAMTKAERAVMDTLRDELALAKALRYSGLVEPERMAIPDDGYVKGWDFNAHSDEVDERWSERSSSGYGTYQTNPHLRSERRDGRRLYATRRDALIGLRLAMEKRCAKQLAAIDALIERETQR